MTGQQAANPSFVPSPRWLSESPARQGGLAHASYSGQPSLRKLKSPIPPPPANLYAGGTSTFNIDPGLPFLETAGPTDARDAERKAAAEESPRRKKSVGGFVTGVKKAVRRSVREPPPGDFQMEQDEYDDPTGVRDSGYASSLARLGPPPPIRPPYNPTSSPSSSSSHRTLFSPRPPSETLIGDHDDKFYDKTEATAVGQLEIPSSESMASAITADPEFGSDYAKMDLPSPAPSNVSFNTYLNRIQTFIHEVSSLPWVARERVTTDYYPELSRRDDPSYHPLVSWHSHNYSRRNYHLSFATPAMSETASSAGSSSDSALKAPHRGSYALDLDAEFHGTPSALPQNPPDFSPYDRTPRLPGPPGLSSNTPRQSTNAPFIEPPPSGSMAWQDPSRQSWGAAISQAEHPPVGLWNTDNARQLTTPSQPRNTNRRSAAHSPARRASHRSSGNPPLTSDWEEYPRYMNGYVEPQFAEHHYGSRYGPGIHSARPPIAPVVSGPPSTISTRQPQPSYPSSRA